MAKTLYGVIILLVVITITCTPSWKTRAETNNANLMKLEMGMSKEEVINIMGTPNFNEAYRSLYGKSVVILFYYTQRKWADGSETKDETTPVVFENGELIGWGDEFYRAKMELDINIKHE